MLSCVNAEAEVWARNFGAVVELRHDTGRLPRTGASASQRERVLGRWLHAQRRELRRGELDHDRRSQLDHAVPSWRGASRKMPGRSD
ncbi:helicase associated domain-containing protein [Nakamurella alba]|uniref:helicase associated domain-containing protein n=1 Tax=Nakamurella alba TaxID=2665158 RepID=UPI003898E8FE